MNSNEQNEYKESLKLARRQREIIVGVLLGDGHLETQNGGQTYRLKVEHSEKQHEYIQWLYNELRDWIPGKLVRRERPDKGVSYYFTTYSHPSFRFYGQQFYPKGHKQIPHTFHKIITPLALAIWFMDDGSLKSKHHRTYNIHTLGYSKSELKRVLAVFEEKLHFSGALHRQKIHHWRIYIPTQSVARFRALVEPHIHPSMRYKLG